MSALAKTIDRDAAVESKATARRRRNVESHPHVDWLDVWNRFIEADSAIDDEASDTRAQRRQRKASALSDKLYDFLLGTPANDLAGVAAKLALLHRYRGFTSDALEALVSDALDDLRRIGRLPELRSIEEVRGQRRLRSGH